MHASSVTLYYFIGGESYLYLVRWSVSTTANTATYGGPGDVRTHPYGCDSMHATGVVALRALQIQDRDNGLGTAVRQIPQISWLLKKVFGHLLCDLVAYPSGVIEGTRSVIPPACTVTPVTLTIKKKSVP